MYRYSEGNRLFQRKQIDAARGRSEKRRESETKGETERNAAECMGGDGLCLASALYLIVLILSSVCSVATHQHF